MQSSDDGREVWEPGGSVQFENERAGIAVDNHAGQVVVLPVDEPVAVGVLRVERRTDSGGDAKALGEPGVVYSGGLTVLQDAHTDRRVGVKKANGKEAALRVEYDGEVARLAPVALPDDGLIEDPWVAATQCALSGGRNVEGDTFGRRSWQAFKGWQENSRRDENLTIGITLVTDADGRIVIGD